MRCKFGFGVLLFWMLSVGIRAQGRLEGSIVDQNTTEPLIGATLLVEGPGKGSIADIDGNYAVEDLPAGTYSALVQYVSYNKKHIQDIVIKDGQTTRLDIQLDEANIQLEGVQIVATRRTNTELSMLSSTKMSNLVVSGVSSQQITRSLDRDAGEVVKRVSGVTIQDNRFVVVRGLNQRYNNVWLNDASTPSSEADRRAFSFDVVPGGLIDNLLIFKTPAPELPADFSGGFVKVLTKNMPAENETILQFASSWQEGSTFQSFDWASPEAWDVIGLGTMPRRLDAAFPNQIKSSMTPSERASYTAQTSQSWDTKAITALPDLRFSATINRRYDWNGAQVGMITAFNYSNTFRAQSIENNRYGIYQADIDAPFYDNDYSDLRYEQTAKWGLLHNWSWMFGADHRIDFRNFFNQMGLNRLTYRSGIDQASEYYVVQNQERYYTSRGTYAGQLSGKHNFEASKQKMDWVLGYAYANRYEPGRMLVSAKMKDPSVGFTLDANDVKRYDQDLQEHVVSGGLNWEKKRALSWVSLQIKSGLFSELKTRVFDARNFAHTFDASKLPDGFSQMTVEQLFTSENIASGGILLRENTNKSDAYSAYNFLNAAYLGVNLDWMERIKIYTGVRGEHNRLRLDGYESDGTKPVAVDRSSLDLFPSVNATYTINPKHLIRLAYGASINRPEFREIAPYVYYDFDQFAEFVGNEQLKDAYINNFDLRYEWYPTPTETFSVAAFYKNFKNPIESTYFTTSSGQKFTYRNANEAYNFGVELDVRKNLTEWGMKGFSLVANASWIKSHVLFEEGSWERDRAMQGQSPYLINGGLYYDHEESGFKASVLYNRIGKRIVFLGVVYQDPSQDIPDIYELSRDAVDVSVSKKIGSRMELGLGVKDVVNAPIQFAQFPKFKDASGNWQERRQVTRSWTPGRNVNISFRYKL